MFQGLAARQANLTGGTGGDLKASKGAAYGTGSTPNLLNPIPFIAEDTHSEDYSDDSKSSMPDIKEESFELEKLPNSEERKNEEVKR